MTVHIRDIAPGTYDIAWGDGQTLPGMSYTPGPSPTEFTHTYANGNYTLTVTDSASTVHTASVKVPAVKAILSSLSPPAMYADDPPTTVNATGTFDGTQKAYVDGIEMVTPSAGGTGFSFQATPGTFPLEEGNHMVYAVQADGTRSNGKPFTVFPASSRTRRKSKSK